jgi:hypothetical protein
MQWLRKLFKEKPTDASVKELSERVFRILNDYGAFLENSKASAYSIVDAQNLPWPKEQIKHAILIAIDSTSDEKTRDFLAAGLFYLPWCQAGVGATPVGLDFSDKTAHTTDAEKITNRLLPQMEAAAKWHPIMEAEQAEIKAALKARGIVL